MNKDRDLYYGKTGKKSRGKKRSTVKPVTQRRKNKIKPKEIKTNFNNETVTAYGGYAPVKKFLNIVGIEKEFVRSIKIPKRSNGYTIPEMGDYLIDGKILGLERLMHLEVIKDDPLLTGMYGLESLPVGKTVGEYLKSYSEKNNESFDRMNQRMNDKSYRKLVKNKKRKVIIDYDSSTMTVYGKQEGADRGRSFRKKDKGGFQPKFAFINGSDLMINQRLYPQSKNLGSGFWEFHEETLKKVPDRMVVTGIRGDGAIYSEENIEKFEEESYIYAISAALNGPLKEAIYEIEEDEWVETEDEKGRIISTARIKYEPKTWEIGERTFIISRRLKKDASYQEYLFENEKYKYFAYITNYKGSIVERFKYCVQRCTLERCIKESKIGFSMDSFPCAEYEANKAYLYHVQLAYNLMIFYKLFLLSRGVNRWTIDTIRRRLILIPGNFIKTDEGWILNLPRNWLYKHIIEAVQNKLSHFDYG